MNEVVAMAEAMGTDKLTGRVTRIYDYIWFENIKPRNAFAFLAELEPGDRVVLRVDGVTGTWRRSAPYTHRNSPAIFDAPTFRPVEEETMRHWLSIPKFATVDLEFIEHIREMDCASG